MVKVLGRLAGDELAYKVMAKGYAFEVTVFGHKLRIKHLPEGKVSAGHLGAAFDEVRKFLDMRAGAAMGALLPVLLG